jgi:hypothetical protein
MMDINEFQADEIGFGDLPLPREMASCRLADAMQVMPESPGIYCLIDEVYRVYYIGKSEVNLRQELTTSDRTDDFRQLGTRIAWLCLDAEDVKPTASQYIAKFEPPLNPADASAHAVQLPVIPLQMTREQQLRRYLEIKAMIRELEVELEGLKANIVTFVEESQERGEKVNLNGCSFSVTYRKQWEYSPAVAELAERLKQLKKQEEKNGTARVAGYTVFPSIKGKLMF